MEPTIYKPGVYNTPGVYKGAGGIYKGRGVYNDGAGGVGGSLIYETDFTNFDPITGIDTPIVGSAKTYTTQNVEKTTRTIGGDTLTCIHLKRFARFYTTLDEVTDYDTLSIEYTLNKDAFRGIGSGSQLLVDNQWPICPFYNCYHSSCGIGAYNFSTPEPGFYTASFGITSNNIDRGNVTRIITGGITADRITNKLKGFIVGKKAATLNCSFTREHPIIWSFTDDASNTDMNIYRIRVYKNRDLFEEME